MIFFQNRLQKVTHTEGDKMLYAPQTDRQLSLKYLTIYLLTLIFVFYFFTAQKERYIKLVKGISFNNMVILSN